jgi:hypothetical protein
LWNGVQALTKKYKYLFRFGHGPKTIDLLGPSISYFWNDIYDLFDLHREMFVEKLGSNIFSSSEIKRLFRELSEDMEEDFAEIWLEIQNKGKRLRFLEMNILPGLDHREQEELLKEHSPFLGESQPVLSTNEYRILHFADENTVVSLVDTAISGNDEVKTDAIEVLLAKAQEYCAKRRMLVTWNDVNKEARSLAEESKIELLNPREMLKEINERNLDLALEEFQLDTRDEMEERFTKKMFKIYLDQVRTATSNLAKKETLEHMSKYFLNGVKGFRVIDRNYRGPSEELDLLVANESEDSPLKTIGNPIAVECSHRRKPASSKDIRDFKGKLEDIGLKAGIMITLRGITGDRYDAVGVIRDARKSGISIIVITLENLRQIIEGKTPIDIVKECFYTYV